MSPARAWGLLVTGGVLLCWMLLVRRARGLGYEARRVLLWVLLAFPIGALAAGGLAALVGRARGLDQPLFGPESGGMTVLGAMSGCLLFSVLYIRAVFREPAGRLLDAVAFTYPLALAFGRVGCLVNGCCYGRVAGPTVPTVLTLPIGFYGAGTLAHAAYAALPGDARVWDFPLLLVAGAVVVLIATERVYRRRAALGLADGVVFALALALDCGLRAVIELTRDEAPMRGMPLNPWQGLVIVFGVAAALEAARRQWMQRSPASTSRAPS